MFTKGKPESSAASYFNGSCIKIAVRVLELFIILTTLSCQKNVLTSGFFFKMNLGHYKYKGEICLVVLYKYIEYV